MLAASGLQDGDDGAKIDDFEATADQIALSALLDAIRPGELVDGRSTGRLIDDQPLASFAELNTEGVWRKTGSLPRIKQLLQDKMAIGDVSDERDQTLVETQFSVHDRCSAVKKLYRPPPGLVKFLSLMADEFFATPAAHLEEKALKAIRCYLLLRPMDIGTRHLLATLVETVKLESYNRM